METFQEQDGHHREGERTRLGEVAEGGEARGLSEASASPPRGSGGPSVPVSKPRPPRHARRGGSGPTPAGSWHVSWPVPPMIHVVNVLGVSGETEATLLSVHEGTEEGAVEGDRARLGPGGVSYRGGDSGAEGPRGVGRPQPPPPFLGVCFPHVTEGAGCHCAQDTDHQSGSVSVHRLPDQGPGCGLSLPFLCPQRVPEAGRSISEGAVTPGRATGTRVMGVRAIGGGVGRVLRKAAELSWLWACEVRLFTWWVR